jgi:hypothetical protein
VQMTDFKTANALYTAIAEAVRSTRWDARAGLLAEIARIRP